MLRVALISTLVVTLVEGLFALKAEHQRIILQFNQLEASLVDITSLTIESNDEEKLISLLGGILTLPNVYAIKILIEGRDPMKIGRQPQVPMERLIEFQTPNKNQRVQLIFYSDLMELVRQTLWNSMVQLLGNFVVMLAIAYSMRKTFQHQVIRPLETLSHWAESIQLNSIQPALPQEYLDDPSEFGQVYRAFDNMQINMRLDFEKIVEAEAQLEKANSVLEIKVKERTQHLIETSKQLVESSRRAGIAEIATGVLHNLGNLLTSVNIKVQNGLSHNQGDEFIQSLKQLMTLFDGGQTNLLEYFSQENRLQKFVLYLESLLKAVELDHHKNRELLRQLNKDLSLITKIISNQQTSAKQSGQFIEINIKSLIDEILTLLHYDIKQQAVEVVCNIPQDVEIESDKHKILQILTNIIVNAIQAQQGQKNPKRIEITVNVQNQLCEIAVTDAGIGISKDQMDRIFRFGYTTKQSGHGFGLHASFMDAKILGGELLCRSPGSGLGATFTLLIPQKYRKPTDPAIFIEELKDG